MTPTDIPNFIDDESYGLVEALFHLEGTARALVDTNSVEPSFLKDMTCHIPALLRAHAVQVDPAPPRTLARELCGLAATTVAASLRLGHLHGTSEHNDHGVDEVRWASRALLDYTVSHFDIMAPGSGIDTMDLLAGHLRHAASAIERCIESGELDDLWLEIVECVAIAVAWNAANGDGLW